MIHWRVRDAGGAVKVDPPLEDLHRLVEDKSALVWIDIEAPEPEEVGLVGGMLGWQHLTTEDVAKQGQRAKLEHYHDYFYLVMHDLIYDANGLATPEVDLVVGHNYVVSVHQHPFPRSEKASESDRISEGFDEIMGDGPGFLLYFIADRLVDSYFPALDDMHDAVEDLEQQILAAPTESLLPRIFEMKREAILLRKVIGPQLEVFSRLTSPGFGLIDEKHSVYFRDVHDHLIRVHEGIDSYRELMSGVLDAYLSNVNNRMSEVMKRLTVLAALFLPLTFITGLLGMNLRSTPPWDDGLFWVFLALMGTLSLMQWLYFRSKHWV